MEERTFDEIEVNDMEATDEETSENSGMSGLKKLLVGAGVIGGVGVAAYLIKNRKKIKENRKRRRIEELRAEGYYICEPGAVGSNYVDDTESEESSDEE